MKIREACLEDSENNLLNLYQELEEYHYNNRPEIFKKSNIKELKQEAVDSAINSGADPDSIEVHVEIDAQTGKVTAIATGSTEVKATDLLKECDENEATKLVTKDFGKDVTDIKLSIRNDKFFVFEATKKGKNSVRIVDRKGFIKVQCSNAFVTKCKIENYKEVVEQLWEEQAEFRTDSVIRPDYFICYGPRISDYSAIDLEQIYLLMDLDLGDRDEQEEIIIVASI